jgi:hypothetical protein
MYGQALQQILTPIQVPPELHTYFLTHKTGEKMQFNMTPEQKLRSLEEVKKNMLNEIYGILVSLGQDPDTFEVEAWTPTDPPTGNEVRVTSLLANIVLADAKIAELS